MKISIIIPAYNCSKHIAETIASIGRSGLNAFEIIVVNDGSTDDTDAILEQLKKKHQALRVIKQRNSGVSAARNKGIDEAEGDYVFLIDADDSLEPNSLLRINEILEQENPDMLMFGMYFDFYHKDKLYRSDELSFHMKGIMRPDGIYEKYDELFQGNMLSPVWNKIIRRELIVSNHIGFQENMIEMEDYLFSVSCLAYCSKVYILDKAVYHYVQAEDEMATFRRLWRLGSLSRYVEPFYKASERFDPESGVQDTILRTADQIYSMLFHEQLRFASLKQIRLAAEDMISGDHATAIRCSDPKLYCKLEKKHYASVWGSEAVKRAKHRAAVWVKYKINRRKIK